MYSDDILDFIRLSITPGIGPKMFWKLLDIYKSPSEVFKYKTASKTKTEVEKELKKTKCRILLIINQQISIELKLKIKKSNVLFIEADTWNNVNWPVVLYYFGNLDLIKRNPILFVGARNASLVGRSIAYKFSSDLSKNFVVMSGMALGIDTCILQAALDNNAASIAVLPFGFNYIYPKDNMSLFEQIKQTGLVLSGIFPSIKPSIEMFHLRNQLMVSLTQTVIIIEAALNSGTMYTSRLALENGKELLVVPGSPLDYRYFGSNLLIKDGANLVQTSQDILDVLHQERLLFQEAKKATVPLKNRSEGGGNHGHRKRVVHKLLSYGSDFFSDYEIVELMLFLIFKRKDTKQLAKHLLFKFKNINNILNAEDTDLLKIKGIGVSTCNAFKIINTIVKNSLKTKIQNQNVIMCFADIVSYCSNIMKHLVYEEFHVILLDLKNTIIKDIVLQKGTIDTVEIYPREVVKECIKAGAKSIILVHNHPSGDTIPSANDIYTTKKINEAISIFNIILFDHIIIGKDKYTSFRDLKLI